MQLDRRLDVVLGEAEPDAGILRLVLEYEGFRIVGEASSDEELERTLAWARPGVIVLDGGISAPAALDAREHADGAAVVVVWPSDVAPVVAEERVDPDRIVEDLGDAVRRAWHRTHALERVVDLRRAIEPSTPRVVEAKPAAPVRRIEPIPIRKRARVLVAAAAWMVFLIGLATIAVAVPNAFEIIHGGPTQRPSPHPAPSRAIEEDPPVEPTATFEDRTPSCDPCRPDRAREKAGTKDGGGRAEDPAAEGSGNVSEEAPTDLPPEDVPGDVTDGIGLGGSDTDGDGIPDPIDEGLPDETGGGLPDAAGDVTPDDTGDVLAEATGDVLPEATGDVLPETIGDVVPDAIEDGVADTSAAEAAGVVGTAG